MKQVGTVEVLLTRIYPLDPTNYGSGLEVSVPEGTYPLYVLGTSYFWLMTGNINTGRLFWRGDGMATLQGYDTMDGPEVTFPSNFYGPEQFKQLMKEAVATEGHDLQRLRITMNQPFPTYESSNAENDS